MSNVIQRPRIFRVILGLAIVLSGCSKQAGSNAVPLVSPMAASIHFQYAVYMLPVHAKDPLTALRNVLAGRYANLTLVSELPKELRGMLVSARVEKKLQREYAPPDERSLKYSGHGLSDAQVEQLQRSQEAFILDFGHPKENVWSALHTADLLVEDIARESGGLVWDQETREIFSPDAWHKRRLQDWPDGVPDISTQTTVHVYENGEFARAITLGMAKAGLPDVIVEELPWSSGNQVVNLINLFSQAMVEGAVAKNVARFKLDLRAIQNARSRDRQLKSLEADSSGVACLTLKQGTWEDGDPKNQLIQLAFDRYKGNDVHAKQEAAISLLFGAKDVVGQVEHTDELLEVSRTARSNLPELHKDFDAGLQAGEYIDVKAPFKTPRGNEWMWVEIGSWKGQTIRGVLRNDPVEVQSLHAGQIVEVREEDVFDYIRHFPDGRTEGNTTGEVIKKQEQEGEAGAVPFPIRGRKAAKLPDCTD